MATPTKATGIKRAGAESEIAAAEDRKAATVRKKASKSGIEERTRTDKSQANPPEVKSLGEEAFDVMAKLASKLVERLLTEAMKGNMKSAEMLVKLAFKEGEAQEALRHGPLRSQALAWAAEQPWQDEVDPKQAESGI
jgi:hypothetical protein